MNGEKRYLFIMTKQERVVVGIFANPIQMRDALIAIKQADFSDEQIGFVIRDEHRKHTSNIQAENRPYSILRGLVGGIMGVADALLVPITGPADATNILATALPMAEDAIDHLPQRHKETRTIARPDAPMTATQAQTAAEPTPKPVPTEKTEEAEKETSTFTGEVVGGVVGAAIGILIPGIGPAIVVGSLAALFGAAFGGVASSFLGTFIHLGIPAEKAQAYEHAVKSGQAVVTIKAAGGRASEAQAILLQHGAQRTETH